MKAFVLAVGDELLSGLVVNTNAALIGRRLLDAGVRVAGSACVGDDEDAIVDALRDACAKAGVVVVCGGLGPTQDDRTREAVARFLDARLARDEGVVETIRERFASLKRSMPDSNLKQADVPEGAETIPNPVGTAPGLRARYDGSTIYVIPGVPKEASHMLDEHVVPDLRSDGPIIRTRDVRSVGIPEAELAERLNDLARADEPKMAFLPSGGEVRLRFVSQAADVQTATASLDAAERVVRERLGAAVYGTDGQTLEAVIGLLLAGPGLTLSTAESCTAGLLSARIASVPGASAYLRGGLVAYQSEIKAKGLGISPALIESVGPVSGEVALEMARGARIAFDSDLAVSITCAAGPGPQGGAQPGTTVIGLAGLGKTEVVRELRLPGDREQVRAYAVTAALNLLRLHLLGEPLR